MIAEGGRDGAMDLLDHKQKLRSPAPADATNQSTTGDSGGPSATGQASSRLESGRGIAQPAFQNNRVGRLKAPPVQLATSHQRHQQRCSRACFAAPYKKPILPPERHRLHQPLGRIVVDRQATILHIPVQRCPLIPGEPPSLARRTLR